MRLISRRPRVTVSKISPQVSDKKAKSIAPVDSTAVGRRGTRPVLRYSDKIGRASAIESEARNTNIQQKNCNGRSSLMRNRIVLRMRNPSRYVRNLLADPFGRALYGRNTSAVGIRNCNACTVSSVSISKPRGKRRKGFDEASGENPVTGEHVAKVVAKNASYNPREQLIAKTVTSAICLLHLCRARRVDHIELMVDQHLD